MNKLLMSQLTFYERQRIESLKRRKYTQRDIAKKLGRDHSVINREIKRNSSPHLPYSALSAQHIFQCRKQKKQKRKLEKYSNRDLHDYVTEKLKQDWSPDEIACRLKLFNPLKNGKTVSHESIYQYVYDGEGKYERLFIHLRNKQFRRRKKQNRHKNTSNRIENRVSIHDRPIVVDNRKRVGDWEDDSMLFSKQKNTLAVLYERRSKLCRIKMLPNKTAEEHENAVATSIESLPVELWKTITRDNGTENVKHLQTFDTFGIQSYFCDAYSSWQKGGVENTNKLLRQYLPRKLDLSTLTNDDIYIIQERLNNRPRKALNYLTPNEFIANYLKGGAFTP